MSNLNLKPKQTYFNVSPQLHKDKQNLCSMHHVLWLTTLAAWDHFTRKREMKTYGCMIWQVLLCCIQLQNFFFLKRGQMLRLCFGSSVRKEKQMWWEPKSSLSTTVIFTHQLRSPAVLHVFTDMWIWRAVEPTFQWVVLLRTASIHSQVRSHSPTPSASRKNFWRLIWTKGFFFCWYGGCTLLHTVNVRVTVWVTISPHYQTHRTPLKHTKADSGLGKKRKKAESMASNNAGQESP